MAAKDWIDINDRLPNDAQQVICWLPKNTIYMPGKTGETEERNIVLLRFGKEFFLKNVSKTGKATSPHFWLGVGGSNHFFEDVTHWMPLPEAP